MSPASRSPVAVHDAPAADPLVEQRPAAGEEAIRQMFGLINDRGIDQI